MDLVHLIGQIMTFILVNGRMIIKKDLEFSNFQMGINMKENLKKTKSMDLENIIQTQVIYLKAFLRMII